MKNAIFCLIISLLFFSCKKMIDIGSYQHCHFSQSLDSTAITNKIVGSWKWTKQSCSWDNKTTKANKNIIIIFNSNATFTVLENSSIITQGNWRLKKFTYNNWGLDLTSPSSYLFGRVLFCSNQILFNNSSVDGCDNLFEKVN